MNGGNTAHLIGRSDWGKVRYGHLPRQWKRVPAHNGMSKYSRKVIYLGAVRERDGTYVEYYRIEKGQTGAGRLFSAASPGDGYVYYEFIPHYHELPNEVREKIEKR